MHTCIHAYVHAYRRWETESDLRKLLESHEHGHAVALGTAARVDMNDAFHHSVKSVSTYCGATQVCVYMHTYIHTYIDTYIHTLDHSVKCVCKY